MFELQRICRRFRSARDFEILSREFGDKLIVLNTAEEIVRFSPIVRKSISYLDLELYYHPTISDRVFPLSYENVGQARSRNFVNTQEKFRMFFSSKRRLLYTLNLDLRSGKERSLGVVPKSPGCTNHIFSTSLHIHGVLFSRGIETEMLSDFIEESFRVGVSKLSVLKCILKASSSPEPLIRLLKTETSNKFIDCFYPEVRDFEVFRDFILQFDIKRFLFTQERPALLEYLLYHARLYGREDLEEIDRRDGEYLHGGCCMYLNIKPLLKLLDSFRFNSDDYGHFFNRIMCDGSRLSEAEMSERWIGRHRFTHMLQIICMYKEGKSRDRTEDASEVLRHIWWSIPDACIASEEFEMIFEADLDEGELKNIHDFYEMAIEENHERVEPRSLQHLCRTVLRRILRENKIWIPEGVSRLGLPQSLQKFLNLEK